MTVLQNIVLPSYSLAADKALYFRPAGGASYNPREQDLTIPAGATVDFNTYFNQFSVTKWRLDTTVSAISLELDLLGAAKVSFEILRLDGSIAPVATHLVNEPSGRVAITVPDLADLDDGLLSFSLTAESDVTLKGGAYSCEAMPPNVVKLGIVITTFRREDSVTLSVSRLHRELLQERSNDIALVVVDNGHTLSPDDIPSSCKLIANHNYGGAGGFARGLYYFQEECQGVTHCLFMDDDASCESEAITRSVAYLSFARNQATAIAGAMLFERQSWLQHENGAYFNMRCYPLKNELDLRKPDDLSANDVIEDIGYGAWWYFAFPINAVQRYPFPFFVRGDDVLFSMTNPLHIRTLGGVASWQESFAWKQSPMTLYLDLRSHVMHYILTDRLRFSRLTVIAMYWRFLLRNLLAYHYASGEAISHAFSDVMQGPDYWRQNLDMMDKRAELKPLVEAEKLAPITWDHTLTPRPDEHEGLLRKVLRWGCLNGHLTPKLLLKKEVVVAKENATSLSRSFGGRSLRVVHLADQTGYELRQSKSRFAREVVRGLRLSLTALFQLPKLHGQKEQFELMMRKDFWQSVSRGTSAVPGCATHNSAIDLDTRTST